MSIFSEPTNEDRADWATVAMDAFAKVTFNGQTFTQMMREDGAEGEGPDALRDLVCDLFHLAQRIGLDPETVAAGALANYRDEVEEEEA